MKYFQIHLRLKSWIPILLFFMTLIHATIQIKFKASPCPKKFSYEPRDSNEDRWYGDVTLPIDGTIEGSTIRLGLDRPSQLLVTTAGPISTNDNKVYIVTHDNVVLEKGSTYKLTFMVKFDKNNTIPMLETIHFNGRRICPEQSPLPLDSGNNEYPSTSRPDPKGTEATDVFSDIDKRPNNPTRTTTRATFVNNNNEDNFNFNSENSNINRFTTSRTTTTNSFNNGGSNLNNLGFNNGGTGNQGNTGFNSGTSNNFGGNPNNFGSSSNLNGNSNTNQGNSGFGTSDSNFGNTGNFGTNSNSNANQGNNGFGTSNSNFGGNTGTFGSNSNSHSNQGGTALNQNFGENNSNFGGNGNSNFGTNGNTNQGTFGQNNFGGSGGAQGNGIREPNQGINSFNTGSSSNVGNNGGSNFNNGNSNNFNGNQASASDQVACGTVSIANPLITLAQNTQYGQWPWHAALFMRDEFNASKSSYICGGSLVSKNKVITAAHCVSSSGNRIVNPDYLTIYLGKYNIHSDENTSQKRKVNDLKVNPKYNKANFHDDIAILSLTSDVDFTNYVRPICLWEAVDGIEDVVGKEGYVVGWGYNEHQQLNEELKMAPMPIVSADKCARSDAAFFAEYVSENAFCAGYKNGTGPCKGDSGGGLVIKRNNAWFLRGIVSVSAAPKNGSVCNTYHYIVFTDVAKYNDFIRRNL